MSKQVISEAQLNQVDLKKIDEVLLASTPQDNSGVLVFSWPRMAPMVSSLTEGVASDWRQLIVVVDDPDDTVTQERVKRSIYDLRKGKPAFEPIEGLDNGFTYRGIPVRFTYRVDAGAKFIGGVDVDSQAQTDAGEIRLHTVRGQWRTREEALAAAQEWTAKYLDQQ